MRLSDMLATTDIPSHTAACDPDITGLTCDSRNVEKNWLFAALPGTQTHGGTFIAQAMENGARAILTDQDQHIPATIESGTAIVRTPNPGQAYAHLAAGFYTPQPEICVGVTGTNGKTSTVEYLRQLWHGAGHATASLGTLGQRTSIEGHNSHKGGTLTTDDAATLHKDLNGLAKKGVSHVALEASSHGLAQYRLDGVVLKAAGFTSFSRDHLDYHDNLETYLAAKMRLFTALRPPVAVLNADMEPFGHVAHLCRDHKIEVMSYGYAGREFRLHKAASTPAGGMVITADILGHNIDVSLPVSAPFQVSNILCALALALACGDKRDDVLGALAHLQPVPGRMERVGDHPCGAPVYIDYAHTPDALAVALKAVRNATSHRVWLVFGCGGDRDAGKRSMMGRVARDLADITVITDDNPRREDPARIRQAIARGHGGRRGENLHIIGDRAQAIAWCIDQLETGDAALIAGKGHETCQIIADQTLSFSDAKEARTALAQVVRS